MTTNDNNTNIIEHLNNIINRLCNKNNIVIYILLPNNTGDFLSLFNIYLENGLSADKYYNNLIIISFFDRARLEPNHSNIHQVLVSNFEDVDDISRKKVFNPLTFSTFYKFQIFYSILKYLKPYIVLYIIAI